MKYFRSIPVLAVVACAMLAPVAWWQWRKVEPRLRVTAPAGQFSRVATEDGPSGQVLDTAPLEGGSARLPITYGKKWIVLTLSDQRTCRLHYFHSNTGVRRLVTLRAELLDPHRCRVEAWFNGIKRQTVEFDPDRTEDEPVVIHP